MWPLSKIKRAYISWWIYQTKKCNVIIIKIVINNNSFFSKGASVLILQNSMLISQKIHRIDLVDWFWFLVFSATFSNIQLYYVDQLKWWKKPEYPERTTDHGQATGKLYHMRLRVECTLFVIYNAWREPTPYWW